MIIIPDMDMPTECVSCPMCDDADRDVMPTCNITGERLAWDEHMHQRSIHCPLIHIPKLPNYEVKAFVDPAENIHLLENAKPDFLLMYMAEGGLEY